MIIIDYNYLIFNLKLVFFADHIFDIYDCDSLKLDYCEDLPSPYGFKKEKVLTSIIDLTPDLDTLWGKLNSKARQKIRKATNCGIKIKYNENYEEFYKINNEHKKKKGFRGPLGYNIPIWFMKKYGLLIVTELDNQILSGALCLLDDSNILCWVMASKRHEGKEIAKNCSYANHLLVWEAMKYAKNKGINKWDWGGWFSKEEILLDKSFEGINQFRFSFGGEAIIRYNYERRYSKLFRICSHVYRLFYFVD